MSNDAYHNAQLLSHAARLGNTAEVERLSAQPLDKVWRGEDLVMAACYGRLECVKVLIPVSAPKSSALHLAAAKGHTECIRLLLPLFDLKAKSAALVWATANGHTECVKLLIVVSDPKVDNSCALQKAVGNEHQSCIDLLYPVSNPHNALHGSQQSDPNQPEIWGELERRISEEQRDHLSNKIGQTVGPHGVRKM